MAIAVYNPFRLLESGFSRDPFFREFFREFDRANEDMPVMLAPRMNVSERADAYEVVLEVPGLAKEDINVEVNEGKLMIWGEKKIEKEDKGKKVHVREISYGAFRREFVMPDDVKQDAIQAAYENGHLKLTLPRMEKRNAARKLEIG